MGMFDAFNKKDFNREAMEIEAKESDNFERKELEDAIYLCDVLSLKIKTTKDGRPMLAIEYKIHEGDFKNQRIWSNVTLCGTKNDSFMIYKAESTLATLLGDNVVKFNGDFDDFAKQVFDASEKILGKVQCDIELTTSDSGFKNVTINEVYDV